MFFETYLNKISRYEALNSALTLFGMKFCLSGISGLFLLARAFRPWTIDLEFYFTIFVMLRPYSIVINKNISTHWKSQSLQTTKHNANALFFILAIYDYTKRGGVLVLCGRDKRHRNDISGGRGSDEESWLPKIEMALSFARVEKMY